MYAYFECLYHQDGSGKSLFCELDEGLCHVIWVKWMALKKENTLNVFCFCSHFEWIQVEEVAMN